MVNHGIIWDHMGQYFNIFQPTKRYKKGMKWLGKKGLKQQHWHQRIRHLARTGRFARLKASLKTNISQYLPQDVDFPTGK